MSAITFRDNMKMTLFGDVTPREVIHKHESHKLHQAFNASTDAVIEQGDMCYLQEDGTIKAWREGSVPAGIYVGIAITDTITPVYKESRQRGPIEVTVAVRGYIVLWGEAKAAITKATYLKPVGRSTDVVSVNQWEESVSSTPAVALFPADAGELVQILALN